MMKFVGRILAIALLSGGMMQVVSAETMVKTISGVSAVKFMLPGELVIRAGNDEKLHIEAEPKVLQALSSEVSAGTLVLGSRQSFNTNKKLKLTLTLKVLRNLKNTGSGDISVEGFSGNALEVDGAGSGSIALNKLQAPRLQVLLSGSGDVTVSGHGNNLLLNIRGSGGIDASDFAAQQVEAKIEGSGDIKVHAEKTLKAVVSGAGNVNYRGSPKVTQDISGAGSVEPL